MNKLLSNFQAQGFVKKYGSPLFVTYKQAILDNIKKYHQNFISYSAGFSLAYSVKTNPMVALLKIFRENHVLAEVCSMSDITSALLAGYKGQEIIYAGIIKTDDELELAVKNDFKIINLESLEEAYRLSQIAKRFKKRVKVGIRLSFPSSRVGLKTLMGISYDRFGASQSTGEAGRIADFVIGDKYLQLIGLHCHTGSNQKSAQNYIKGINELVSFMFYLKNRYGLEIDILNLGGGLGVESISAYKPFDLGSQWLARLMNKPVKFSHKPINFKKIILKILSHLENELVKNNLKFPYLMMEPGRSLIGDTTHLLTTVVGVKETEHKSWLIMDAGTNLMPVLTLYSEYHDIYVLSSPKRRPTKKVSIAGPLLYSADIIVSDRLLPKAEVGDLVVICSVGAYFNCQANQFLYPRPATILVQDGKTNIIQRRETTKDIFNRDIY